jgi:addiction module HigA family antidote
MGPLNVGMDELARDIGLSMSHVAAVIGAERGIDADIAFRLARYFSTTEDFWLRLQIAYDMDKALRKSGSEIAHTITPRKRKAVASPS